VLTKKGFPNPQLNLSNMNLYVKKSSQSDSNSSAIKANKLNQLASFFTLYTYAQVYMYVGCLIES